MKAVVFPFPGQISFEQLADPTCGDEEVIVEVAQAGICGTDLSIYRNEYFSAFPLIAGHEFTGRIMDLGKSVSWLKIGDRVAVDPNLSCGECLFCRQEQSNHCLNWQGIGITRPGAFAEYVAVPAKACYLLPDRLTDIQAAFIEPLSCVIHALKRLRVWPGDEVLIFGAGPMGLLLLQAMRHSGASTIVVVEKRMERLEVAMRMGATKALPAASDKSRLLREIAPLGFAVVVDATGIPDVIQQSLQYLRPYGQYLQFGAAPKAAAVKWYPHQIFHKDLTIIGSFALRYTFQPAIAWLLSRVVEVEPLVSHTLPLSEFLHGFQEFSEGKTLKVHLRPGA